LSALDKDEVESTEVREQERASRALKEASQETTAIPPTTNTSDKIWFGGYLLALVIAFALYYLFAFRFFGLSEETVVILQRIAKGFIFTVVILGIAKASEIYAIGRIADPVSRYNLKRIQKLIAALVLAFVVISVLFVNWYTAVVSVGLISLILGFALQTPITSFIGWIYIMVRTPYRVGDRIKMGDATGDVIDVSYLDTTLWEFGGDLLSTDHPSGRLIKFPNSKILDSSVYNYSSPLFPYVWNEVKFYIAYDSDLEFIASTMQSVATTELGEAMIERVGVYRELLSQTPVDQLEVREHPSVLFRVSENTWLEAIVRYLVHPKKAGRVKTRLIKKLLVELNKEPDRVMFPKGSAR